MCSSRRRSTGCWWNTTRRASAKKMSKPCSSGLVCPSSASGRFRNICRIIPACAELATTWRPALMSGPRWPMQPRRPACRRSTFIACSPTAFSETPHEFVTRLRIDHAKKSAPDREPQRHRHLLRCRLRKPGVFQRSLSFADRPVARSVSARSPGGCSERPGRLWPLYYMPACFQHFFGGY